MRERLADELNVLSRRRVALVAGRVVALAGRGPASLGGTRPGRSRRRRLGGVEQLLQRPTDVDDGQASVEHHAERKHLPQPRPRTRRVKRRRRVYGHDTIAILWV